MTQRLRETLTVLRNGEAVTTGLDRIAERARRESQAQFNSLMHLVDEELLRDCFGRLSRSAAPGIDKVTKDEYAMNLEKNLAELVERLNNEPTIHYRSEGSLYPRMVATKCDHLEYLR